MKTRGQSSTSPAELRAQAEQRLRQKLSATAQMPAWDVRKLVHELHVHQIELEMQNEELEQARDRYVDLYDFAPVTYLTLSAEGEILEANLSAAKLLGLERGRLIREKLTRFVATAAQDTFYLFCRQVFRSDDWQSVDLDMVDAQAKHLFVHVDAVRDPKQPLAKCQFSLTDITPRKLAEQQLQSTYQSLKATWDALPDLVFELDHNGLILGYNGSQADILYVPPEQFLGRRMAEILPPEVAHLFTDALAEAARTGRHRGGVYSLPVPLGLRWFELSIAAKGDHRAPNVGFVCLARDITQRRQTEQALRQQREMLAHVGRISLLGELAVSLAHEINQPLAAILRNAGAARLLLAAPTADLEELRAIIAEIKADSKRGGQVIDRLRSLLKRRELAIEPLHLAEVIRAVLPLVEPDAAARRVTLQFEKAPAALPLVNGNRVHLQQVLLNLLMNALAALDGVSDRPPVIRVRVRAGAAGRVRLEVTDSGSGVPAANLPLLFAPFFTTKPDGMGVGLAISRTIIDAHGGHIGAENNPDGGATFWFELPALSESGPSVAHAHVANLPL